MSPNAVCSGSCQSDCTHTSPPPNSDPSAHLHPVQTGRVGYSHWPPRGSQTPMERGTDSYGWSFHNYWAGKLINSLIILKRWSEFLRINLFYLMPEIQPQPLHSPTEAQWDARGGPELTGQYISGGGCLGGCRAVPPCPTMGTHHSRSWELLGLCSLVLMWQQHHVVKFAATRATDQPSRNGSPWTLVKTCQVHVLKHQRSSPRIYEDSLGNVRVSFLTISIDFYPWFLAVRTHTFHVCIQQ